MGAERREIGGSVAQLDVLHAIRKTSRNRRLGRAARRFAPYSPKTSRSAAGARKTRRFADPSALPLNAAVHGAGTPQPREQSAAATRAAKGREVRGRGVRRREPRGGGV